MGIEIIVYARAHKPSGSCCRSCGSLAQEFINFKKERETAYEPGIKLPRLEQKSDIDDLIPYVETF
jgi:hypothetical protein